MSGAIMGGMGSIVNNAGLLSKVYFPRLILPVSTILAMTVTFGIELGLLIVIMAIVGGPKVLLFLPALVADGGHDRRLLHRYRADALGGAWSTSATPSTSWRCSSSCGST